MTQTSRREQLDRGQRAAAEQPGANDSVDVQGGCEAEHRLRIRLKVKNGDMWTYRGLRYRLTASGEVFEGDTGQEGIIDHELLEGTETATLELWPDPEQPPLETEVVIGPIEPATLEPGAEARFENLTRFMRRPESTWDEILEAYQVCNQLDPTLEIDDPTCKLASALYRVEDDDADSEAAWQEFMRAVEAAAPRNG